MGTLFKVLGGITVLGITFAVGAIAGGAAIQMSLAKDPVIGARMDEIAQEKECELECKQRANNVVNFRN